MKTDSLGTRHWRFAHQVIIRAYPHDYRSRYGQPAKQLFNDILRDAADNGRVRSVAVSALADTLRGGICERTEQIRVFFVGKEPRHARSRRKAAIILGIILIALAAAAAVAWKPISEAITNANIRRQEATTSKVSNFGYGDVTANFVNDYVMAKYYADKRVDVGYDSPHAQSETTIETYAYNNTQSTKIKEHIPGLKQTINGLYASTDQGFDPLICGKEAPTKVRFTDRQLIAGMASQTVIFSYGDSDRQNLVRYDLRLDQSESDLGEWKIQSVNCLSADAQEPMPFVYRVNSDTGGSAGGFSRRNDRYFP